MFFLGTGTWSKCKGPKWGESIECSGIESSVGGVQWIRGRIEREGQKGRWGPKYIGPWKSWFLS